MIQAVPHDVMEKDCWRMLNRPVTEVVLEQARGPVGGQRLTVSVPLWERIKAVALPKYELEDGQHQKILLVDEAALFVTALRENASKAANWPKSERETFQAVLSLVYKHNGLMINKR